jgi:ABC-type multidrug transport system fused ATPase/permease subunit
MYVLNPFFLGVLYQIPQLILTVIFWIMLIIFLTDNIISFNIISYVRTTTKKINTDFKFDNTEEITRKVKEILTNRSVLHRRLMNAYPKINAIKQKIKEKRKKIMEKQNTKKNKFKIPNLSIWQILGYFIIYSIIGFVIETIFGICTKGVLESRRSFLYGPFCSIYGIGAVVMIYFLQYFKKNNYTLFFGGFIIGSVIEYVISFIGELIFNIKWWDYSNLILNINGRICLTFSLFWGLLAIIFNFAF